VRNRGIILMTVKKKKKMMMSSKDRHMVMAMGFRCLLFHILVIPMVITLTPHLIMIHVIEVVVEQKITYEEKRREGGEESVVLVLVVVPL
jgi:hypothetical protein